jgi:hypothetical protein
MQRDRRGRCVRPPSPVGTTDRAPVSRNEGSRQEELERETGFEPATACLEGRNSGQLSYSRSGCRLRSSLKRPKTVAVRTDDIALGCLGQDPIEAEVADHRHHGLDLRRRVAMVELHHAGSKTPAAVGARHRSNLIQDISVVPPPRAVIRSPRSRRPHPIRFPRSMLCVRSAVMAVRADDIAFRDFGEEHAAILERSVAGIDGECLQTRLTMVEIHLRRMEDAAAVSTWDGLQLPQILGRRALTTRNPLDLALAVRGVIGNVERPLVAGRHAE